MRPVVTAYFLRAVDRVGDDAAGDRAAELLTP
jgi:hypothetical protein